MKKVLMLLAAGVAMLGLMACTSNETNAEATTTTEENVEAQAQETTAAPQQRDFEVGLAKWVSLMRLKW